MTDLHEAVFLWPHTDATSVILTGTFDQWTSSIHLTKGLSGFEGTVKIPYEDKVEYKFIVDGQWLVHGDQPTVTDHDGNVNNIYIAPKKPSMLSLGEGESTSKVAEYDVETLPTVAASVTSHVEPDTDSTLESTNGSTSVAGAQASFERLTHGTVAAHVSSAPKDDKTTSETFSTTFPQLVTDFADTIAARDGATSTLEYVASGIGAAIQSFVGVDPINADKIAYKSPVPGAQFNKPGVPTEAESPAEEFSVPAEALTLTEKPEASGEVPEVPIEEEVPTEQPTAVMEETEALIAAATDIPKTVTEEPEVSTEVETEKPKIVPEDSQTAPEDPKAVPEDFQTIPEDPKAVPEDPKTVPEDPKAVPEDPHTVPEDPHTVPEDPQTVPEDPQTVPEDPQTITTEPEVLLEKVEVPRSREVVEVPVEKPGGSLAESEASTEAPSALKLEFSGNAVPMSIVPADEGSNIMQKITQAPVPSATATSVLFVPPAPVPEVPPNLMITPSEVGADEATTAAIRTAWVLGDDETDITTTANQSYLPPATTEVDILPAEPSNHTPKKSASSEPDSAVPATVSSALASSEPTQPVAPPGLEPKPLSPKPTSALSTPALAVEPEPNSLVNSVIQGANPPTGGADVFTPTTAIQSVSTTVPMDEPSTHINIIQSESNPVTPVLAVPIAESLLPVTRTPEPIVPTRPDPIAADDVNTFGSVQPEQVSLASTPNVPGPESAAHILSELEVATGNSVVVAAMPASASIDPNSKPEKIIESSPSKGVTNGTTKSASSSKLSTPIQKQEFPSSESPGSTANSPPSSKVGTASSRKKKSSMFGKLKHIFSKDEKEKSKG